MKYINQLEPEGLVNNFLRNPPVNFNAYLTEAGIPSFSTKFNLLTTTDIDFQRKLKKIPFYKGWSRWLEPNTCFIGTTVSEYSLLTNTLTAEQLANQLKQAYSKSYPFLIVKDIPQNSPLQGKVDNDFSESFVNALKDSHFIEVEGQALAWVPIDYDSVDDYLSRLSASRRKDFKRKLKTRTLLDIKVIHSGDECFYDPAILDYYYQLYLNVYEQSEVHFDLLTKEFFTELLQDKQTIATIITYTHNNKLIGYNICFIINNMLVDKYIGLVYPEAKELNLYFVSWFYNLEYAKQQNLTYYVAGWTDPEVKARLGARFTFTKHMVYVRNPIFRFILRKLSGYFESDRTWRESYNSHQNEKPK